MSTSRTCSGDGQRGDFTRNEEWAPRGIDMSVPSTARMYDYYLGGKDNYRADRDAAEAVLSSAPEVRVLARENRAFLGRAVRYLAGEAGISQFIDIGTGIPTQGNVHEVAHTVNPDARVVYVDHDPVVLAHSRALLANSDPRVGVADADMRDPDALLSAPQIAALINLNEPVAVLFIATLHFVADNEDPAGVVRRFHRVMAPGSHLAISHIAPAAKGGAFDDVTQVYESATSRLAVRTRDEIEALFADFDLVDPGLVHLPEWHPENSSAPVPDDAWGRFCGVAARA